jgi:hypothetical protein
VAWVYLATKGLSVKGDELLVFLSAAAEGGGNLGGCGGGFWIECGRSRLEDACGTFPFSDSLALSLL